MKLDHAFIIGGGNMGAAFARGIIATSVLPKHLVTVVDPDVSTLDSLRAELSCGAELNLSSAVDKSSLSSDCKTLLICAVKPDLAATVLQSVSTSQLGSLLVISCAAGVRLKTLQASLGGHPFVIRAMPNLPVQLQEGVVGYFAPSEITEEFKHIAQSIFASMGMALSVEREELLDAITALSGSGPGYWAFLIGGLVEQAKQFGFSDEDSLSIVLQTLRGTLALLESGELPSSLQARVTSPGGTTARAIALLKEAQVADSLKVAVRGARDKAEELGG